MKRLTPRQMAREVDRLHARVEEVFARRATQCPVIRYEDDDPNVVEAGMWFPRQAPICFDAREI
jgi:hypothetical protein